MEKDSIGRSFPQVAEMKPTVSMNTFIDIVSSRIRWLSVRESNLNLLKFFIREQHQLIIVGIKEVFCSDLAQNSFIQLPGFR